MDLKEYARLVVAVHEIAASISATAASEHKITLLLGEERRSGPRPSFHQTQQGMFLSVESFVYDLHTPFGTFSLYDGGNIGPGKDKTPESWVFKELRRHLSLKFVENVCEKGRTPRGGVSEDRPTFFNGEEGFGAVVTEATLDTYRGTDTLVRANICGCSSVYEVVAIQGLTLPPAKYKTREEYMTREEVERAWEAASH